MNDLFNRSRRITIALCTPWPMSMVGGRAVHEPMSPLWYRAKTGMHYPTNFNTFEMFADGLPVDEARNLVAAACLKHDPVPEFLFWLDWDVLTPSDALTKLIWRARCRPNYDVYCGVYCCKGSNPPDPLIYSENGAGAFWDWAVGDILTTEGHGINAVHSGLTLIRTSLFQRMIDKGVVKGDGTDLDNDPFYKTCFERHTDKGVNYLGMSTEDVYFHAKARHPDVACKILVDTSVLAGHLDKKTGVAYGLPYDDGPARRAKWMNGPNGKAQDEEQGPEKCECVIEGEDNLPESSMYHKVEQFNGKLTWASKVCAGCKGTGRSGLKLALDIGAGETRRQWPGHRTYTLDIRPEAKPDYCQDTRQLNLPDDHFDLVASSHNLEHYGRWDQEIIWKEMFRILKPGGVMEHIVPDVSWAAAKIVQGQMDEHVVNVLYGAQEAHGYQREFNLHYFGYTPEAGKALAEMCGLVDVETRNWKQEEALGYNLVIKGRKPTAKELNGQLPTKDATIKEEVAHAI